MSMSSVREVAVELAHSTGCVPYARRVSGVTRRAGAAQTQSNRKHGQRAHPPPPTAPRSQRQRCPGPRFSLAPCSRQCLACAAASSRASGPAVSSAALTQQSG